MNSSPDRLYFVTWHLNDSPGLTASRLIDRLRYEADDGKNATKPDEQKEKVERRDWSATEFRPFGWLLRATKPAVEIYMELSQLIDPRISHLIIAEVTANSLGTFIDQRQSDQRQREVAVLFGNARRD